MNNIAQNRAALVQRIAQHAHQYSQRADRIQLLAVSKQQPLAAIRAALAAGQIDFGENYLQEALEKISATDDPAIRWHFIGPLQANKTRPVAEHFDWVHSIDRERIARRLSEQRPAGRAPLNVCIQVNVSNETSKSGVTPTELPALATTVSRLPGLRLRGLMALPAPATELDVQRREFRKLGECLSDLQQQGLELDTLSMGTSADFEAAIAEGSTWLRIGSALFGPRMSSADTTG